MGQPDEPTARGYNEDEIRAAEEEFDALINTGLAAAAAVAAAAVAAEPIAATVSDATIAPALTVWNTYVAEVLVPALTRIFKGSAATFVDTAEPTLLALSYDLTDIAPIDEPAAVWMAEASNRLRAVSDIVWEEIRTQLVEGVQAGDGIPELAQRVRDAAGFSEPRARTTARTEVAAASNGGSITQARALGLDMDKQWEATVPTDGRTRLTHIEAHHQTVDLGAKFEVGGDLLDFPGDPTGQAEEVINCRCAVTFLNIRRRQEAPVVAAGFVEAQHPRDREGQFAQAPGGGAVVNALDKLGIASRIKLGDGERLVATAEAKAKDSDTSVLLAMTDREGMPNLRLGIIPFDDRKKWKADNKGATVRLDEQALSGLDSKLGDIQAKGDAFQKNLRRQFDEEDELTEKVEAATGDERARLTKERDAFRDAIDTDPTFDEGMIPGEWGDLAYELNGTDDGEGGWALDIGVKPSDAPAGWDFHDDLVRELLSAKLRPNEVKALRKKIQTMRDQAANPETAAAAPMHTGAMVALVPSLADIDRLAVDDGEPAEELHLTVMYLGDAVDIEPDAQAAVHAMCAELAGSMPPIEGDGFALNVFNPHTDERDTALVMGVGGDGLAELHAAVSGGVGRMFETPKQHTPYVPHVTLAYSDDLARLPDLVGRLGPVVLDRLRVAFGDEVTDYPLTGTVDDSTFDVEGWQAANTGKIRWPQPGSFRRCVRAVTGEVRDPEALCAALHHRATGKWPSEKPGMTVAAAGEGMPSPEQLAAALAYEDMIATAVPGAHFHTLMHTEGISTGRRVQMPGSMTWRTPPIPFNWQVESGMHGGQKKVVEVGFVSDIARHGTEIHGWGRLDLDNPIALEYARKLAAGWVRGVSVGMDEQPIAVEYLYSAANPDEVVQEIYLGGNIMEVTSSGGIAQESAYAEPLPALLEALAERGIEVAAASVADQEIEVARAAFVEAKHKRDGSGKFAKKVGGAVPSVDAPPARASKRAPRTKTPKARAAAKATEPAAQSRADIGALFGTAENPKADAAQAMNGTFGGIDVRVDKVTQSGGSTKVEAKLFDAKGNEVGKTERTFHRGNGDDPDARWVSHDLLYLDKDQQGAGFAQEFNAHMEKAYRDSGVSHIRLEANIDVGGYAWARQGYDFADQATAEKIRDRAAGILDTLKFALDFATPGTPEHARALSRAAGAQELLDRFANNEYGSPGYPTPFDVSEAGRQPGQGRADQWFGKLALLNSKWDGVKWL